jgi:hypothetical protein
MYLKYPAERAIFLNFLNFNAGPKESWNLFNNSTVPAKPEFRQFLASSVLEAFNQQPLVPHRAYLARYRVALGITSGPVCPCNKAD